MIMILIYFKDTSAPILFISWTVKKNFLTKNCIVSKKETMWIYKLISKKLKILRTVRNQAAAGEMGTVGYRDA